MAADALESPSTASAFRLQRPSERSVLHSFSFVVFSLCLRNKTRTVAFPSCLERVWAAGRICEADGQTPPQPCPSSGQCLPWAPAGLRLRRACQVSCQICFPNRFLLRSLSSRTFSSGAACPAARQTTARGAVQSPSGQDSSRTYASSST